MGDFMDLEYFLRLQPGFDNFSDADIAIFSSMLNVSIYPAKHVFTSVGEQNRVLHLIMDGAVVISDPGGDALLGSERTLRVGEWFGLLSLVENLPSFENGIALDPVTVASFGRAHFDDLLELAPPVGLHLLYMLAKQLARTLAAQNLRFSSTGLIPGGNLGGEHRG